MDDNTQLLRQIHPSWIQAGQVTSQAFKPTLKDDNKLSTYNGDSITAKGAWKHYTETLKFESDGVLAITVGESKNHGLQPVEDPEPFPEHVVINFTGLTRGQVTRIAKQFKKLAQTRGWLHQR